ncbi:MAG: hypothetical protein H7A33_08270 [Deltaproteobacteria bacterium]|nr:hypothetical protein [Deltaproteobacteria bacterium]
MMILFGALFALFSRQNSVRSVFSDKAFWHGVVFTTLFNVAVVYAIVFYPDWMWMYFLEDGRNSWDEIIVIFILLYYLPYCLGYYLGRDLKRLSPVFPVLLLISMALAELYLVVKLFDRYAVIGSTFEYKAGTAISLFAPENPIGPVMNGAVAAMVIYFFAFWYWNRKQSKKNSGVM